MDNSINLLANSNRTITPYNILLFLPKPTIFKNKMILPEPNVLTPLNLDMHSRLKRLRVKAKGLSALTDMKGEYNLR